MAPVTAQGPESGPGVRVAERTWADALDDALVHVRDDKLAFLFEGPDWAAELSYGAWHDMTETVAAALTRLGVEAGDRVAVAAPGGPVWPVLQTACSRVGAILLPLNIRYRHDELSHIIRLARPRVIVALVALRETRIVDNIRDAVAGLQQDAGLGSEPLAPRIVCFASPAEPAYGAAGDAADTTSELSWQGFCALGSEGASVDADVDAGSPVLLQFTSGTTAFPKGVILSSRATLGVAYYLGERMGLSEDDRMFSSQPFYHVGGTVGTTLMPLVRHCTMVVPERYRPEIALSLIERHRCTVRTGMAAMYAMELAHPDFRPDAYRSVSRGWGAGAPALMDAISDTMGVDGVIMCYGLTEAGSISTAASYQDPRDVRMLSCGRALPGMEVAIAADGTVTTAAGVVGEICIRGWSLMNGYFGDPDATADAIDPDGWLHTGDVGRLDEDGNLHFVDRLKDMIKPGGENVSAAEVERVISGMPGVARVAVVGAPDARLGEVAVAFVEPGHGAEVDTDAIIAFCAQEMADFKVPRSVIVVDDWPMTESGKVQKHLLRERLVDGAEERYVGQSG